MSCGTTEIAARKLCCVTREISWPSISDAALLRIVEPLQQGKQAGFAAARLSNQPHALTSLEPQIETIEYLETAGILKSNIFEAMGARLDQSLSLGVILQFMRQQQGRDGLGQPGDMLGDVDQRDREIARCTENGNSKRAHQDDIAGGCRPALPQHDGPGQQPDGQHHGDTGMQQTEAFPDNAGCVRAPSVHDRPLHRSGRARS